MFSGALGYDPGPMKMIFGGPEFSPKKHTKQSYRSQQRAAKKRSRVK
jgi:hypothetical protein